MTRGFKHKGLGRFFETGTQSGIKAQHAERLRLIVAALNAATDPRDLALPGLNFYPLKGDLKADGLSQSAGTGKLRFGLSEKTQMRLITRIITSEVSI